MVAFLPVPKAVMRRFFSSINAVDPRHLVAQLNRHIVGQESAKRAIAVAVRDRWARLQVPDATLRKEITPSNILLIGSSGCGKTEIARRLAALIDAPFVKVVATKYTEVGFVGDSTASMVEELADQALLDATRRLREEVQISARSEALNDVARLFLLSNPGFAPFHDVVAMIDAKELDHHTFTVDAASCGFFDALADASASTAAVVERDASLTAAPRTFVFKRGSSSAASGGGGSGGSSAGRQQRVTRSVRVDAAVEAATEQQRERQLKARESSLRAEALEWTETRGIIFIDEFDKLVEDADNADDAGSFKSKRRGVQKELLTLIEGANVQTPKLGRVNTDHILFICAGAFSYAKPEMMMPELQGRLQTQVRMEKLSKTDLVQIMTGTDCSVVKQQQALMKAAENVELLIDESGIEEIAEIAEMLNSRMCNTGARRLQQLLSALLEDTKFNAHADLKNQTVLFDKARVRDILAAHKVIGKAIKTHQASLDEYRKFVI